MDGLIAEYAPHKGTIAMYPFRNDIWRSDAKYMQKYVCGLVDVISKYEKVYFFCDPRFVNKLKELYSHNSNVEIITAVYDDIWARDIGPTFIKTDNKVSCVDWKFNAWGGLKEGSYFPWDHDDAFASFVSQYFNLDCKKAPIVIEGGGITTDGVGTIFTTRSVLLNRNRNPFQKKEYVEEHLLKATGASRVVWLKQGLAFDETNGHIDNVLSFTSPTDVCLAWTDDRKDPNYSRLRDIELTIESTTTVNGERYTIHHIPMPPPQYMTVEESRGLLFQDNSIDRIEGDLLPASYLNFYFVNGAVLIPSFGCETDEIAKKCFQEIFTDREVVQIYSREPLLGGGGIHCILHEVPLF